MTPEQQEAFDGLCSHYGLPILIKELDDILEKIKAGCMSVPLDNDPKTASMQLFKERMKYEGALAMKNSLIVKIKEAKKRIQESAI